MSKKRKIVCCCYKIKKIVRDFEYIYIFVKPLSVKYNIKKRNCMIYNKFKLQFK